jgi:hypothetical protein
MSNGWLIRKTALRIVGEMNLPPLPVKSNRILAGLKRAEAFIADELERRLSTDPGGWTAHVPEYIVDAINALEDVRAAIKEAAKR